MPTRLRQAFEGRQRGQMLLIFALLIFPVSLVLGVVAVDASMWQSERRGAQKDADLAALAGAIQLLNPAASGADAISAADQYRITNDESGNSSLAQPITAGINCDDDGAGGGRPSHVKVDVNHKSRLFFGDAFGLPVPAPGAHACARAGSVTGTSGLVPFQIDQTGSCYVAGKPQFGQLCGLEYGAQASNPRGLLDLCSAGDSKCLDASGKLLCSRGPGSGDPYALITNGSPGHCLINTKTPISCDPDKNGPWGDCAAVQTGNTKNILDGVNARIAREGACDRNGDGIESFTEVVRLVYDDAVPSKRIYEAIDCVPDVPGAPATLGMQVSPRLVTVIVFNGRPDPGNDGYPIVGFAGFYIAGCSTDPSYKEDADLSTFAEKKCDIPGAQAAPVFSFGGKLASPQQDNCEAANVHNGFATCTPTSTPTQTPIPTNTPPPTSSPTPPGNTWTPTNTPGGSTSTPTSIATPGGGGGTGHAIVYGDFVNLITTNAEIGDFDPNTTITGVTLVQ